MKNVQALNLCIYLNSGRHHPGVIAVCLHNYSKACTEEAEIVESRTPSFSISITAIGFIVSFLFFIFTDENCI